jgi:hypothetical protein
MRGNTWRLIGAIFIALTISLVVLLPLFWGLEELPPSLSAAVLPNFIQKAGLTGIEILASVPAFIVIVVEVTVLSKFYLHIMGTPDHPVAG